jgi:hypothetical protein
VFCAGLILLMFVVDWILALPNDVARGQGRIAPAGTQAGSVIDLG